LERRIVSEQVYTCSPGDLLASILNQTNPNRQLYLLTGSSGSGKTSWCLDLVAQAREAGLKVAGLLSPAVFSGDAKTGIDLLDLSTQVRRHLASPRHKQEPRSSLCEDWQLDEETLAWGNRCLLNLDEADILILDEMGPLEYIQGKGLLAGLQLIDASSYRLAVVTIRPSLLDNARQRWPDSQVMEISPHRDSQGDSS
jgi:nucleoside-triphosphatase THEP1